MATTVTLKPNAIDLSGSTSGTTTLQASAVAGTTTVTLPAATDTLVGKATTDTLTNKTLTSPTLVTPVLGTPASGSLANCTAYPGTSALTTVGALNSGSITSGFGAIDIGADWITAGRITTLVGAGAEAILDLKTASTGYGTINMGTTAAPTDMQMQYTNATGILTMRVAGGSPHFTLTSTGLNSTVIGATTPAAGSFTTLSATTSVSTLSLLIGGASAYTAKTRFSYDPTGIGSGYYADFGYKSDGNKIYLTITDGGVPRDLASFNYSGAVTFPGTLAVTGTLSATGLLDLSAATAGQIQFPATQNASSNANTLDDYDEYTATSAACTGAITTAAVWKLTKVGNLVTLTLPDITGTASGTNPSFDLGTALPAKYRPLVNTAISCLVSENGATLTTPGRFLVLTTGVIKISRNLDAGTNWSATAGSGLPVSTSFSWTI